MRIFISAPFSHTFFINTIEELVKNEYSPRHQSIYIPWTPCMPRDPTLLGRIRNDILNSHLYLMDITPEELAILDSDERRWVSNQGVLIEYGIIVGLDWLHKLCIYCNSNVGRDTIHPAFHKAIDVYSTDDLAGFQATLRRVIRDREISIENEGLRENIEMIRRSTNQAGSISPFSDVRTGSR